MSTLDIRYADCCTRLGWQPRSIINSALSDFEKLYDSKNSAACFLQLPTGYGKSTITLALGEDALNGGKFGQRVIHVLPLRSIIHDLRSRLDGWFGDLGLDRSKISAQYMGSAGSPFFANKVVITTLDSFSLNLFKLPAFEVSKAFRRGNAHFETARGFIYSSAVVFDEAHLFALDQGKYRQIFTVFASSLKQLSHGGVPLFIITATLPKPMRHFLQKMFQDNGVLFTDRTYKQDMDPTFEASSGKRNISASILSNHDEALKIVRANQNKNILIIVNEVTRAVQFYNELRSLNPILLHGKMIEKERKENVERIYRKDESKWIIIGTQVIEAGIDVNASILISDLAPIDRLVQRIGRVARYGGSGEVYIIENYSMVYDANHLKISKSLIQSNTSGINWTSDAQHLIDSAYSNLDPDDMIDRNLWYYLSYIDESLMSGAGDMVELINTIKSFPRETSLVKAYAPQCFSNGDLSASDGYIAIDSSHGSDIIQKSKKVVKDSRIYNLDQDHLNKFLQEKYLPLNMLLEKEGFDGIVLDRYQKGVGYV